MNWNKWIRQIHRWVSVLFTVAVVINGVAVARGKYSAGLGVTAVLPLAVLLLTGLYLLLLPYAIRGRTRRAG